jgi:hypothetical protein
MGEAAGALALVRVRKRALLLMLDTQHAAWPARRRRLQARREGAHTERVRNNVRVRQQRVRGSREGRSSGTRRALVSVWAVRTHRHDAFAQSQREGWGVWGFGGVGSRLR